MSQYTVMRAPQILRVDGGWIRQVVVQDGSIWWDATADSRFCVFAHPDGDWVDLRIGSPAQISDCRINETYFVTREEAELALATCLLTGELPEQLP